MTTRTASATHDLGQGALEAWLGRVAQQPLEVLVRVFDEVHVEGADGLLEDAPHRLAEVGDDPHQAEARKARRRDRAVVGVQQDLIRIGIELAFLANPVELRPCHNDLLNANFIDDGTRIRIVDWEYAGMGDPFFDLGNFSINHELTPDEDAILLAAYDDDVRPARLARLTLMRTVSDFREAMWGVLQQGISSLDVDFVAYAGEHFERLLAGAAAPSFERALGFAAGN